MNIDKAIRLLSDQIDLLTKDKEYRLGCAFRLGIEALKRVKDCRAVICDFAPVLLPGETKE